MVKTTGDLVRKDQIREVAVVTVIAAVHLATANERVEEEIERMTQILTRRTRKNLHRDRGLSPLKKTTAKAKRGIDHNPEVKVRVVASVAVVVIQGRNRIKRRQ